VRLDRCSLVLVLSVALAGPARADSPPPPSDLTDYVKKADPSFAWKLNGKTDAETGTVYTLDLVSQTWHGIKWEHKVQVFVPKGVKPTPTVVLWNQGGTPNTASGLLGLRLAEKVGAPVVFVYGIPNQPLLGDKREDALIAETFVRYLETKDGSWPLLFPMVKSLTKAMDAVQAFAKDEWKTDVKHFVVTGASKRGWTSWLTAATGDPRVKAIAPMVIDTLNMPVQAKNQVNAFGKPSEMIHDYVERKLVPVPDTPEAKKLWTMIDPWVYREKLTLPKMIINGANDPYWPLDALNSYWDDLKGEKYVLYVPNAGHDLRETDKDGKKELLPTRAVNTLAAFCKCQIFDKKMPRLSGKFTPAGGEVRFEVGYEGTIKSQRVWIAESETQDFRNARWVEKVLMEGKGGGGARIQVGGNVTTSMTLRRPARGFAAVYVETEFEIDGLAFPLSTPLRILEAQN
jgi:PhoPQ-activated pathogenicity-related protein